MAAAALEPQGAAGGEPGGPLVWEAFYWGLVSALSLNIGSVIGVTCLPGSKVRAILMSFGGGALLFALSIELFGRVLHESETTEPVWVMMASSVVGGLFFAALNYALNAFGADVRKPSTRKSRFRRLRALLYRRLALRLWKIPFLSVLSLEELRDLIQGAMYKERFGKDDVIMSGEAGDRGDLFFILSGQVRVQIFGKEDRSPLRPGEPGSPGLSPGLKPPRSTENLGGNAIQTVRQSTRLTWWEGATGGALSAGLGTLTNCWDSEVPLHEWQLGPNQLFGDMSVLTGMYVRSVAAALEPTKVLVLPGHEVARLLEENDAVRDQVSMRAVERLRQVAELRHLPDHSLASLSARSQLRRYRKGDVVFHGTVTSHTPIVCLVLGSVEIRYQAGGRRVVHAGHSFCTEHLKLGEDGQPMHAEALEPTSALILSRTDLDIVKEQERFSVVEAVNIVEQQEAKAHMSLPGQVFAAEEHPKPRPGALQVTESRENLQALSGVGKTLGWDDQDSNPSSGELHIEAQLSKRIGSASAVGQVTDLELQEAELAAASALSPTFSRMLSMGRAGSKRTSVNSEDVEVGSVVGLSPSFGRRCPSGRSGSKRSTPSKEDRFCMGPVASPSAPAAWAAPRKADDGPDVAAGGPGGPDSAAGNGVGGMSAARGVAHSAAPPPVEAFAPKRESEGSEAAALHNFNAALSPEVLRSMTAQHRAQMVWLGILIDAVPESLVIGIIINAAASTVAGVDNGRRAASAVLPFVIGVFISNLPESMSSSGSMKAHGMRVRTILLMWLTTTVLTACGASLGALLFPPSADAAHGLVVHAVEGLAAGAMLTMIAQTMMPEAFEQGGDVVGLSCLAGFLCALSVKLIPINGGGGH